VASESFIMRGRHRIRERHAKSGRRVEGEGALASRVGRSGNVRREYAWRVVVSMRDIRVPSSSYAPCMSALVGLGGEFMIGRRRGSRLCHVHLMTMSATRTAARAAMQRQAHLRSAMGNDCMSVACSREILVERHLDGSER
jgi:hypothetical protein